jgi:DNA-binding CsgD family transcriptional regulator
MDEPFVGRDGELALLTRHCSLAAAGHGSLVLVVGPPGVGKTTLTRRFLAGCDAKAIWVSGDVEETPLAGGLLEQVARSAAGPEAGRLGALLDEGEADPVSAGSALLRVLGAADAVRPRALVVDDAHWGDELSLKALGFAARRLAGDPVLCVIIACPEELHRLPPGLLRACGDYGERLDVAGLAPQQIEVLAGSLGVGRLSRKAAERLCEHAGGIPLHVTELLHDLPAAVLRDPGSVLPAPRSLGTLVLSRLATCASQTEHLVVAAAVLGQECRLADAAVLAGLDDPLPGLQEAIGQRLLIETSTAGGRGCAFAHQLIRAAVYRDIGVSRRAALHRAAARLTSGAASLGHRVAGCQGADETLASDLETQARSDLAVGKPREAAEHLLAAVQVGTDAAGRNRRLLAAVWLLVDLGDAARAAACAGEVAQLASSFLQSLILGRLALLSGNSGAAERWMSEAWASRVHGGVDAPEVPGASELGPGPDEAGAVAACELALMLLGHHRASEAVGWARRAASSHTTGFTRACSRSVLGASYALTGRGDLATALLHSELDQCEDARSEAMVRVGLGSVLLWTDEPRGAAAELAAVAGMEDPDGLPMADWLVARMHKVLADYRRGAWEHVAADAEKLVALADDLDQGWLLPGAHAAAVYICAGRGEWALATSHLRAAAGHARPGSPSVLLAVANAATALAVARDEPAGVLAAAEPLRGHLEELADLEPTLLGFWPCYAQALARCGRIDEAEGVLRPFEDTARARARRSALAAAARVRGCLAVAHGQPEAARARYEEAAALLAAVDMPFEEAITRLEYGRLLRRLGQRRAALRELSTARTAFASLRASPFLQRCDTELGQHLQDIPAQAGLPLTSRQLAVAQAVAKGKTNRQVAAELYITTKTVEFHLSQILARLGVDSRNQIAAALGRHGPGHGRP